MKLTDTGLGICDIPDYMLMRLDGNADKQALISAIKQADKECGSCGCDFDPLYKKALKLLS